MVLFDRGMHGFIGGVHGFIWGVCGFIQGWHVWFYSGGAWFYSGGMHGFIWGGEHGFFSFFGYNEIRSMSGRYASYWNAFLLGIDFKMMQKIESSTKFHHCYKL